MKQRSFRFQLLLSAVLALTLLCGSCFAVGIELPGNAVYCFSKEDFSADETLRGIYVCSVPSATVGEVSYGSRVIRAGDILPAGSLQNLSFFPCCENNTTATIAYLPISSAGVGEESIMTLSIFRAEDTAPTCEDSSFETYKNIANTGTLAVTDETPETLTYQLVKEPKRGTVELHEDGSFTYTPSENKVGKDSFVYTATDSAGNVSNEATVKIKIVKPTDKARYTDMANDADEYYAMWLKEQGIYTGKEVAGCLCFGPNESISRGDFLVMAMKLFGKDASDTQLTSGFADESETPQWMRPFIVSALRNGVISGASSDDGYVFRPANALTKAEAAVMLQNILKLPDGAEETWLVDEQDLVPTWAVSSLSALETAGMELDHNDLCEPVTMRGCAKLLYEAANLPSNTAE